MHCGVLEWSLLSISSSLRVIFMFCLLSRCLLCIAWVVKSLSDVCINRRLLVCLLSDFWRAFNEEMIIHFV